MGPGAVRGAFQLHVAAALTRGAEGEEVVWVRLDLDLPPSTKPIINRTEDILLTMRRRLEFQESGTVSWSILYKLWV